MVMRHTLRTAIGLGQWYMRNSHVLLLSVVLT
jgi:hypothetical protein